MASVIHDASIPDVSKRGTYGFPRSVSEEKCISETVMVQIWSRKKACGKSRLSRLTSLFGGGIGLRVVHKDAVDAVG